MKNEFSTLRSVRVSKILSSSLLALVLFCAAPSIVMAQEAAAAPEAATGVHTGKIAVVDVQFLVSNSAAGKSIRTQLERQRNGYKGQIEKQEADLRAQEKRLGEQQNTLSKDAFMEERKKFQQKVIEAQKSVQQRRVAFDKAYATATDKLRENIVKVVADLAAKRNVSLVMSRQDLILVDARLDMTEEVLKALDARVTSIPVSLK